MFLGLTVSASAATAREPGVYQERALAAPTQDFSALGLKADDSAAQKEGRVIDAEPTDKK